MSINPVFVPTSLVSQFLENEKIASRRWLQCQMESLLDHVFGQLNTKFEDFVASRGITGTGVDHQMDPVGIEQNTPSFQMHSHPHFPVTADHLINSKFHFAVGQSSKNRGEMINYHVEMISNLVHREVLMFDKTQHPPMLSAPTFNHEQLNQNDNENDLDLGDDGQRLNDDMIDDNDATVDSDEIVLKEEIYDSHDQLFITDKQPYSHSLSTTTSNLDQSNRNDDEEEYGLDVDDQLSNGQLNDDIGDGASQVDCDQPEVKEKFDDTNNQLIITNRSQSPPTTSNLGQSNQNDDEEKYDLNGGDDQSSNDNINDDVSQVDCGEVEIKVEFDDTNSETIIADENLHLHQPVFASASNEISNHNLTCGNGNGLDGEIDQPSNEQLDDEMRQELIINEKNDKQSNQNLAKRKCDDEGYNDNGHGNNVKVTQHNEEPSRPRKKPKLNPTQPNNRQSLGARKSSRLVNRKQTDHVEPNNQQATFHGAHSIEEVEETNEVSHDKQIVTISLQCLQTGCPLVFDNKCQLNLHMSTHSTLLYRCLVKDCKQSYTNSKILGEHIAQVHPNTTEWHCDKCSKHFPTYHHLSNHNICNHQLGLFQCAYLNCTFTGGYKQIVYNHYRNQHKPEFICQHPDCGSRFKLKNNFEVHQRVHLGIKPYRCKWSACGNAFSDRSNATRHIKRVHLKQTQSSHSNELPLVDPKQYLEEIE